jgi:hypothetical protein
VAVVVDAVSDEPLVFKVIPDEAPGRVLNGCVYIRAELPNGWHPPCFGHRTAEAAKDCFLAGGCIAAAQARGLESA